MINKLNKRIFTFFILFIVICSLSVVFAEDNVNLTVNTHDDVNISFEEGNSPQAGVSTSDGIVKNSSNTIKNSANKTQTNNVTNINSSNSNEELSEDCATNIIQVSENESVVSFRRDSSSGNTNIYITNDGYVKQFKTASSYFFHVIISHDGWIVGNGGVDSGKVSSEIETLAVGMINNKTISSDVLTQILRKKINMGKGHFIIKAPNGTYGLVIYFPGKKIVNQIGRLLPGQYIVSPNSPQYLHIGNYVEYAKTTNVVNASRYLLAMDKYGQYRHNIMTYHFKTNGYMSTVDVYAANDDGSYVGRSDAKICDNVYATTVNITRNQLPRILDGIYVETIRNIIKPIETVVKTNNIQINNNIVNLSATVLDKFGNKVNQSKAIFKFNGITITDKNSNVIMRDVVDGKVSYAYALPNMWKNNFNYSVVYLGNKYYLSSRSNTSNITTKYLKSFIKIDPSTTTMGRTINIITSINYTRNNSKINFGKTIYKINGVTIKNSQLATQIVNVKDGIVKLSYKIPNGYSAGVYNLSVSFINGNYRQDFLTKFTLKKIETKININKINSSKHTINIQGTLKDANGNNVLGQVVYCVKINGLTIKKQDNKVMYFAINNGVINATIKLPDNYKLTNYNLTIVTQERKSYLPTRLTKSFTLN